MENDEAHRTSQLKPKTLCKYKGMPMKLGNAAIGKLAMMICGDDPYCEIFPYRSSSYLTSFFEEIDLDYVHDGSTRYWWVRSTLMEMNDLPEVSEDLPSAEIIRAIEYLLDPDHFSTGSGLDQAPAVDVVNELLRRYELVVQCDKNTGNIQIRFAAGSFVSTAVSRPETIRKITFSPAVFSVPEKDPDSQLVSVMMPFSAEYSPVYTAIKEACNEVGLSCYRADDIWEESTFIQDIFNLIYQSSIVIVDFTARNSNVMYETGISHTLGKNVVPLTQSIDDIPSDLKPHRALKYFPNKEGLGELKKQLTKRLQTLKERLES